MSKQGAICASGAVGDRLSGRFSGHRRWSRDCPGWSGSARSPSALGWRRRLELLVKRSPKARRGNSGYPVKHRSEMALAREGQIIADLGDRPAFIVEKNARAFNASLGNKLMRRHARFDLECRAKVLRCQVGEFSELDQADVLVQVRFDIFDDASETRCAYPRWRKSPRRNLELSRKTRSRDR